MELSQKMEKHWKTSDASYDARISLANMPNYQWDVLKDNGMLNLDHSYLKMLLLLTGQPAKHKPETFPGACKGQQYETRKINELHKDDDGVMKERAADEGKRTEGTEMLTDIVEGHNTVTVDNEMIGSKRKLERFKRDLNELKRIKNIAVELENSMMEKAKELMLILNRSKEHPTTARIQDLDSQTVQIVANNADGNLKLGNNVDATCLVQAENIMDNIKIEQDSYVPDGDVEVIDRVAILEQGMTSSFVPNRRDIDGEPIGFRRDLMNILIKPFDKEEYEDLSKLFKEGSYRDHYPAVGRKLSKYRYKTEKRINIFRGFFFWLKNMTQEGAFTPWDDRECLAI